MMMKRLGIFYAICAIVLQVVAQKPLLVEIINPSSVDREKTIVEIPYYKINDGLSLGERGKCRITDMKGKELPMQHTYDGNCIFFIDRIGARESLSFYIHKGQSAATDTLVSGACYPERLDDIAWENDCVAFRTYGPALEATGEKAYGYDIWAKRVDYPVVKQRYEKELKEKVSYHQDHGDGLDCYSVGPTLGGGTSALLDYLDRIIYPYCYRSFRILDNGPLRFTVELTYRPFSLDNETYITEHRVISLDRGSYLNKTIVRYKGLSKRNSVVTGIVLHQDNPEGYVIDEKKNWMAYADLTDNPKNNNGILFLGAVFPDPVNKISALYLNPSEAKMRRANGHVLAYSTYQPGKSYIYYWGNGWSKYGFSSMEEWTNYLTKFKEELGKPLKVKIK